MHGSEHRFDIHFPRIQRGRRRDRWRRRIMNIRNAVGGIADRLRGRQGNPSCRCVLPFCHRAMPSPQYFSPPPPNIFLIFPPPIAPGWVPGDFRLPRPALAAFYQTRRCRGVHPANECEEEQGYVVGGRPTEAKCQVRPGSAHHTCIDHTTVKIPVPISTRKSSSVGRD